PIAPLRGHKSADRCAPVIPVASQSPLFPSFFGIGRPLHCIRSARQTTLRRWSPTEEIGWYRTQEIGWYPSQEIGWVRSEEILQIRSRKVFGFRVPFHLRKSW